jgi:hypothetical protein
VVGRQEDFGYISSTVFSFAPTIQHSHLHDKKISYNPIQIQITLTLVASAWVTITCILTLTLTLILSMALTPFQQTFKGKSEVPQNKKVTYANFICDYRPLKTEPHRVRLTVGGDKLDCEYDAGSPAASLLESKLIMNSTISDAHKGARFLSADLKDHFLASPMEETEYMRIHSCYFLKDITDQYNIKDFIDDDGYVYVKIKKGMYSLKQAVILAYKHLVNILKPYSYSPCPNTTGLWKHESRPTKFCLCVDDFGVKYFSQDDADHLLNSLCNHYKISVDYTGKNYCGLTMDWDYAAGYVNISMPKYIPAMLKNSNIPNPNDHNMLHINGQSQHTVEDYKWHQLMIQLLFHHQVSDECNQSLVQYFTTLEP